MVAQAMSTARDEIIRRIRAVDRAPGPSPRRNYRRAGRLASDTRLARFCERVSDYRADVRRIATDRIAAEIAAACRDRDAHRLCIPAGLPTAWRPDALDLVEDEGMSPRELDALDGVVTGCTVGIAETGTIVLTGAESEGRRALTLVPDLHVCIVFEDQIVELVPEAIALLGDLVRFERRPLTFISGPSATSDIELSRVEGVHGPRNLVVLVVSEESR
jgi:L-lactate dehydrogenase complex protein LldG